MNEFTIEQIQLMTKIYKRIESLDDFGDTILQGLLSLNSTSTVEYVVLKIELLTSDFLSSEKRTKQILEEALSNL